MFLIKNTQHGGEQQQHQHIMVVPPVVVKKSTYNTTLVYNPITLCNVKHNKPKESNNNQQQNELFIAKLEFDHIHVNKDNKLQPVHNIFNIQSL